MDERTWMKWGVILGGMLGAVTARGDMTVRKIVFQGRGVARPEVQLVVSSGGDGYSAQLWKGDYLWSDCRQARHSTGRLNFVCGSQEVRLEPPARAVLLRPQGDSVDHEELEVLTAEI